MIFNIYNDGGSFDKRYAIGNSGTNQILVIGTIPSTATEIEADQTTTCAMKIADAKGYNGFILINIYPIRRANFDGSFCEDVILKNFVEIEKTLMKYPNCKTIWAAWGDNIGKYSKYRNILKDLCKYISSENFEWLQFGSSTNIGNPRTPIGNSYGNSFNKFDISCYLSRFT